MNADEIVEEEMITIEVPHTRKSGGYEWTKNFLVTDKHDVCFIVPDRDDPTGPITRLCG